MPSNNHTKVSWSLNMILVTDVKSLKVSQNLQSLNFQNSLPMSNALDGPGQHLYYASAVMLGRFIQAPQLQCVPECPAPMEFHARFLQA